MDELHATERSRSGSFVQNLRSLIGVGSLMILFLTLLTVFAIYRQTPPDAVTSDASALVFSSGRAMKRLGVSNQKPHPVGSLEHAEVRNYILRELSAEGLAPQVQETTVLTNRWGDLRAATVRNIAARLVGAGGGGKAVLIAGHYDTVPASPGAGDDGVSVAAMLETVRALKAGSPLNNDIIFLFTDAEEIGLLGAKAFVDEHPWAKDVGLVLNFEARGTSGSSVMFETSNGNGWLIEELAKAAPHPVANSLSYEIYKLLPNNTDMTIFRGANLPGMNFAFIDSPTLYHSNADRVENIDERSLQHQGSYILSLARHFGDVKLDQPVRGNAVYFDVLGMTLLHYPGSWVLPLMALTLLLFTAVFVLGFRRKKLTVGSTVAGFFLFVLTIIVASLSVTLIWWLVSTGQRLAGRGLLDDFYRSKLYFAGFVLIAIAVTTALYNLYGRRVNIEGLNAGALFFWLILMVLTSILLPGASYLLTWPLLFALAALAFTLATRSKDPNSLTRFVMLSACALPGLVLVVPMIYQVFVALGLGLIPLVMIMVVLLCGLLVPHFALMRASGRWWLPAGATLAAAILVAMAIFNPGFDQQHPKSNNLFYVLNADTGKAVWASSDASRDEWTSQFLPANAERAPLRDYLPLNANTYLNSPAPVAALQPVDVRVISDNTQGDVRTVLMRVSSTHEVVNLAVPPAANVEVLGAIVNGKRTESSKPGTAGQSAWELNYWSPPKEGFDLALELRGSRPVPLKTIALFYSLPEIAGTTFKPRPDYLIPSQTSDQSLVSKSFSF